MSKLFEKGYEYEKQGDYVNAMQFYLQASQENNAEAQFRIGMMYFTGKGVPKDRAKLRIQGVATGIIKKIE